MSDLGLLRQFLRLEITQDFDGIMETHSKYNSYLLINFNIDDFKATHFSFLSGINLEEGNTTPQVDSTLYRQLIGSLIHLIHSRSEICYVVNAISRYMQQPHELYWREAKRILQYVQGTRSYGIHLYAADSKLDLVGFTESD